MTERSIGKNESGQRLDKYLAKLMPKAPKSFFYKMLRKKNIVLNGKKAEGSELLAEGDQVRFFLSDETIKDFSSDNVRVSYQGPSVPVVYEDADILILNKPCGLLSQGDKSGQISCADFVISYLQKAGTLEAEEFRTFKPAPVNRLDRNTSGLILCGKSLKGEQVLSKLIRERRIRKSYLTIVKGCPSFSGRQAAYARKDENTNTLIVRKSKAEGFSEIITDVQTLSVKNGYSLLKVGLVTGKSHQIRAHLSFLGYPLLGDVKYGYRPAEGIKLRSQLLHSFEVSFPDQIPELPDMAGKTFKASVSGAFKITADRFGLVLPPVCDKDKNYE